jgi:TetR/AcrR family transcriptional repressor of nem operon
MMGTMVLARITGSGELSDDILAAGREAVLGRVAAGGGMAAAKNAAKKTARKTASARH